MTVPQLTAGTSLYPTFSHLQSNSITTTRIRLTNFIRQHRYKNQYVRGANVNGKEK